MSVYVCSKIIKELPGLVGSGTPCSLYYITRMAQFKAASLVARCQLIFS